MTFLLVCIYRSGSGCRLSSGVLPRRNHAPRSKAVIRPLASRWCRLRRGRYRMLGDPRGPLRLASSMMMNGRCLNEKRRNNLSYMARVQRIDSRGRTLCSMNSRWITAMTSMREKGSIQSTWKIIPRGTIHGRAPRNTRRLAKRSTTNGTVTHFLPTSTPKSNISSSR